MTASDKKLELMVRQFCPYCRKVRSFMDEKGIDIPIRDVYADVDAMEKLAVVGGKNQVPCLFINDEPLYESDDIIAFLDKEFA